MTKDSLIECIDSLKSSSLSDTSNESEIRKKVISPIIALLGWFGDNIKEEYPVPGGIVDYALLKEGKAKVFVEAKQTLEAVWKAEKQLSDYANARSVPIGVLTTGMVWRFYVPSEISVPIEQRLSDKVDIKSQKSEEVADKLIKYLGKENVHSGKAEAEAKDAWNHRKVEVFLQDVWEKIKGDPDERLVDLLILLTDQTHHIKPTKDEVREFVKNLSSPPKIEPKPKIIKDIGIIDNSPPKDLRPWAVTVEEPSGKLEHFGSVNAMLRQYGVPTESGWENDMIERAVKSRKFIEVSRTHNDSTKEVKFRLAKP